MAATSRLASARPSANTDSENSATWMRNKAPNAEPKT
jgi:hypothetical protein